MVCVLQVTLVYSNNKGEREGEEYMLLHRTLAKIGRET